MTSNLSRRTSYISHDKIVCDMSLDDRDMAQTRMLHYRKIPFQKGAQGYFVLRSTFRHGVINSLNRFSSNPLSQ